MEIGQPTAGPGNGHQIVIEDVPDQDAPNRTIRRAQRVDPLIRILGNGERKLAQWSDDNRARYAEAERYRDNTALAAGARPPPSEGRRAGGSDLCADDVRVMAQARVRAALARITATQANVVGWIVLGGLSLRAAAVPVGLSRGRVREELIAALDAWRGVADRPGAYL